MITFTFTTANVIVNVNVNVNVIGFVRRYASLGEQLRRAARSVPLNIAEGVGKTAEEEANALIEPVVAMLTGMCR